MRHSIPESGEIGDGEGSHVPSQRADFGNSDVYIIPTPGIGQKYDYREWKGMCQTVLGVFGRARTALWFVVELLLPAGFAKAVGFLDSHWCCGGPVCGLTMTIVCFFEGNITLRAPWSFFPDCS